MLININPLISPEILQLIRSMGHGDKFVLSDANFPSYSHANKLYRMDGLNIPQAAEALLTHFPLDSFIPHPVERMEIDGKPDEVNEVHQDLIDTVKKVSGDNWVVGSVERQKFYVEAKKAMAVITTSDTRPYGCFMFTKGVLKPDGTVWII
ncbi:ribose ABC transporter [Pelagibacteraceae bacterium]|nr:ribose ABC transporter [Pelagibacteraceae bacterium]